MNLATLAISFIGAIGGWWAFWIALGERKRRQDFELRVWSTLQARKLVRPNGGAIT